MLKRIAALACCALLAGCLYDWSVDKAKDAGGDAMGNSDKDCALGSCNFVCPANTTCTDTCSGGSCTMTCAAGSTCDLSCSGGSCIMTCEQGASCTASCAGGGCLCTGVACP